MTKNGKSNIAFKPIARKINLSQLQLLSSGQDINFYFDFTAISTKKFHSGSKHANVGYARASKARILDPRRERVFRHNHVCFPGLWIDVKLAKQRVHGSPYFANRWFKYSDASYGNWASNRRSYKSVSKRGIDGYPKNFYRGGDLLYNGSDLWWQVYFEHVVHERVITLSKMVQIDCFKGSLLIKIQRVGLSSCYNYPEQALHVVQFIQ